MTELTATNPAKKSWESSNAWIAATLAVLGLWTGINLDEIEGALLAAFAVIPTFKMVHNRLKRKHFKPREFILEGNFFNYLVTFVTAVFPSVSPELFQPVEDLVKDLINVNWQGVIISVSSIVTIFLKWNRDKQEEPRETTAPV